jgi:hypothetical protein
MCPMWPSRVPADSCHVLQALYKILCNAQNHKKSIVKEACWTVSNVTAGTKEQINAVIESGCIVPLVHLLEHGEIEIKREAAWAISNATAAGDMSQIQHLVSFGCLKPLCHLLQALDQRVVQVCHPNNTSTPKQCHYHPNNSTTTQQYHYHLNNTTTTQHYHYHPTIPLTLPQLPPPPLRPSQLLNFCFLLHIDSLHH